MGLDHPQEKMPSGSDRRRLPLQVPAQALGHRQHPLPHWQGWEDVIDQVGGGLRHAPGVARGANAAPLAGEGHQDEFDRLNTRSDMHSSEADMEMNPGGSKLYAVWAQWVFEGDRYNYEGQDDPPLRGFYLGLGAGHAILSPFDQCLGDLAQPRAI